MCFLGKDIKKKPKDPWMRCESIYIYTLIKKSGKSKIPVFPLRSDLCHPFQMMYQNQCEEEYLFCGGLCLFGCTA